MDIKLQEYAYRWIPRLLGIAPLLIFGNSLFTQGGPARGILMVLVVLLLAGVLLVFYTGISIISDKRARNIICNPSYAYISNPWMSRLCQRLDDFAPDESTSHANKRTSSIPGLLGGVLAAVVWLVKGVIASPTPYRSENQPEPAKSEPGPGEPTSKPPTQQQSSLPRDYIGKQQRIFYSRAGTLQDGIRWLAGYILQLRIQVGIMLIGLLLFQTQQVKDIVLAMVLDGTLWPFVMATVAALMLSLLLWHTSRQLTRLFPAIKERRALKDQELNKELVRGGIFSYTFELFLFWLAWLSLALFTVPVAKEAYEGGRLEGFMGGNWHLYVLLVLGALMIFLWRKLDQPNSTWVDPFPTWFWSLFILGFFAPFLIRGLNANQLPQSLGSITILFWALSIFLVISSTIYQLSLITNFPFFSLLLASAYLVNINRFNDNHAIRLRPYAQNLSNLPERYRDNRSLPGLEDAFNTWHQARMNKSDGDVCNDSFSKNTEENPTTVYVVSAQGGGIYAAYHTAKALAVLSEEVPCFSNHLFMISGVSGGSVGATVFVNSLRTATPSSQGIFQRGELSNRIDDYFEAHNDRLAMILSTMLFGDMMQRFYPIAVPAWDRTLGLELGFENLNPYRQPGSKSPLPIQLDQSFYHDQDSMGLNNQNRRGLAPYLMLNTTEVENGRRYILSPFKLSGSSAGGSDAGESDADFHEPWLNRPQQMMPLDLRYSTAAGMSARFPIVSPYGFFPEARARRFVDGGLYDNSGAVTAKEVIDALNKLKTRKDFPLRHIEFIPIAIADDKSGHMDSSYADADNLARNQRFRLFGWSAIDAVFSTRESRVAAAVDLFGQSSDSADKCKDSCKRKIPLLKQFRLEGEPRRIFSVPLGWKLSCQARAFINDQIQPYPGAVPQPKQQLEEERHQQPDGYRFRQIACEQQIRAVKREPVRAALPSGTGSDAHADLSRPFWELIHQLRHDLARQTNPSTPSRQDERPATTSQRPTRPTPGRSQPASELSR
ncbi:MAG: hypothetical protein ACKO22_12380 [Cyanobium sp.]